MDDHEVRRRIRRAIDPGPGFPAPMLWERAVSRLDEPAETRRGRWHAAALAAVLLCFVAIAGGLRLSRSVESRDQPPPVTVAPAAAPAAPSTPPVPMPPTSTRPGVAYLQFVSASAGWLVEYGAGGTAHVLRTTDGGATWTIAGELAGVSQSPTLRFFDDHQGLVIDGGPQAASPGVRVHSTTDGGAHWQTAAGAATAGSVRSVSFTTMSEGWLLTGPPGGGATMSVFHSADGGRTWDLLSGPSTQPLLAGLGAKGTIQFATPQNGWIEAFEADPTKATLLATHDGGRTWHTVDLPPPPGVSMAGKHLTGNLPTMFGQDGLMTASLTQPAPRPSGMPADVFVGDTAVATYLYETHDGGRTWSFVRQMDRIGVQFADVDHWYREDPAGGGLQVSDDGGRTWSARPVPHPAGWYFIRTSFIGPDGWGILSQAAGYAVLRTTDDGAHWTEAQLPPA
jgi:photosystem II stability/assembly factor-like uncharacterized protein